MSLGDRCDEIVRLIDETLAAYEAERAALEPATSGSVSAPSAERRRLVPLARWTRLRRSIDDDTAAGTTGRTGRVA
jgi:hypothetical protein